MTHFFDKLYSPEQDKGNAQYINLGDLLENIDEVSNTDERKVAILVKNLIATLEQYQEKQGPHGNIQPRFIKIDPKTLRVVIEKPDNIYCAQYQPMAQVTTPVDKKLKNPKQADLHAIGVIAFEILSKGKFPKLAVQARNRAQSLPNKYPNNPRIYQGHVVGEEWSQFFNAILLGEISHLSDTHIDEIFANVNRKLDAVIATFPEPALPSAPSGSEHDTSDSSDDDRSASGGEHKVEPDLIASTQKLADETRLVQGTGFHTMPAQAETETNLANIIEQIRDNQQDPLTHLEVAKIALGMLQAVQDAASDSDYQHGYLIPEGFKINLDTFKVTYVPTQETSDTKYSHYRHINQFQDLRVSSRDNTYLDIYAIGVMLTELLTGELPMSQLDELDKQPANKSHNTPRPAPDFKTTYIDLKIAYPENSKTGYNVPGTINIMTSPTCGAKLSTMIGVFESHVSRGDVAHRGDRSTLGDEGISQGARPEERGFHQLPKSSPSIARNAAKCGFWGGAAGLGVGVIAAGIALTIGYFLLAPVSISLTAALVLAAVAAAVVLGPAAFGAAAGATGGAIYASCHR
ncbi:MAG: hypothetical protein CMF50_08265 [Legionellales bacterium]|nr:hypothetical protein [Legionellales bacterium]|tara:strand:+ start:43759 stop:45483 length:1725 start_codon:yes stop_codon:yes gene_type:complete